MAPLGFLVLSFLAVFSVPINGALQRVASWNQIPFILPPGYPISESSTPSCTQPGVTNSNLNTRINSLVPSKEFIYVTLPRTESVDHPASLGRLYRPPCGYKLPDNTPIDPYPGWDWHRAAAGGIPGCNCSAIVNAGFIRIDRCNRLWVLDSGVYNSSSTNLSESHPCPPKLLAFDLYTNQLVKLSEIPSAVLLVNSYLRAFELDELQGPDKSCDDMFIYISDSGNPAIVVWDVSTETAKRKSSPEMYGDKDSTHLNVKGECVDLVHGGHLSGIDNLVAVPSPGTASEPCSPNALVFFKPNASNRIFSVNTTELQSNENNATATYPVQPDLQTVDVALIIPSQSFALTADRRNGNITYSTSTELKIWTFAPGSSYPCVRLYSDQFDTITDLYQEIIDETTGVLWIPSCKYVRILLGTVDCTDINHNIFIDDDRQH